MGTIKDELIKRLMDYIFDGENIFSCRFTEDGFAIDVSIFENRINGNQLKRVEEFCKASKFELSHIKVEYGMATLVFLKNEEEV
ncbi:MAG: hypothetical protein QXL94_04310 [Candidatus Parvarchaeum sp.]